MDSHISSVQSAWLADLERRHLASLTRQEFTRAVRALSARYVERRQQLPDRSPLDSAGKRAAFALFYAPVHYLTALAALDHFGPGPALTTLLDLGCGTGVCSAAWAHAITSGASGTRAPDITGVDAHAWTVAEARWDWRALGLRGRGIRGDMVERAQRLLRESNSALASTGVVASWAVNELSTPARTQLLDAVETLVERGTTWLLLEPIARGVTPWWGEWLARLAPHGVIEADIKCALDLPAPLASFSESAGFRKREIGVRVMTTLPRRAARMSPARTLSQT